MPFLTNFPKCWEIFQIILWNILSNSKQYKKFRRSLRLIFPQYWIPWLTCVSVRVNSSWFPVILGIFHPLLWIRNLQFSTLFMYSYKHNIQHFAIIPVLLVLINNRLSHPLVFPHVSFFFRKQSLTTIRKLFRATLIKGEIFFWHFICSSLFAFCKKFERKWCIIHCAFIKYHGMICWRKVCATSKFWSKWVFFDRPH